MNMKQPYQEPPKAYALDAESESQIRTWLISSTDFKKTPSAQCGMKFEDERAKRVKCSRFIELVGKRLALPTHVFCTAKLYVQRFYLRNSFTDYEFHEVAAGALFLACKTGEHFRPLRKFIPTVAYSSSHKQIQENDKEYMRWRQIVLFYEQFVAAELGFNFGCVLPHDYLNVIAKRFGFSMESISQAFDLCTDSLNTWVPLVYHPFFICVVAYYTTICGQGIAQPTDPSTGQLWLESLEAKQSFCREIGWHLSRATELNPDKFDYEAYKKKKAAGTT